VTTGPLPASHLGYERARRHWTPPRNFKDVLTPAASEATSRALPSFRGLQSLAKGERLKISVVGMLTLSQDITPELADKTIESVYVRGALHASSQVKDVLADRMH
jgi:Ribbon-Helix-Helix transcriptional regulator family